MFMISWDKLGSLHPRRFAARSATVEQSESSTSGSASDSRRDPQTDCRGDERNLLSKAYRTRGRHESISKCGTLAYERLTTSMACPNEISMVDAVGNLGLNLPYALRSCVYNSKTIIWRNFLIDFYNVCTH